MKLWIVTEVSELVIQDVHVFFDEKSADDWFKRYTGHSYGKFYSELGDPLDVDLDETKIFIVKLSTAEVLKNAITALLEERTKVNLLKVFQGLSPEAKERTAFKRAQRESIKAITEVVESLRSGEVLSE